MSRIERWLDEEPRRPPAEIGCLLARDRFWKDGLQRLIGSHRDLPELAGLVLALGEELAHALVLVLSRLPAARRRGFADAFYERRRGGAAEMPEEPRLRLALAAAIVLSLAEIVDSDLYDERRVDLLQGAAQQDDLARTPGPAVDQLRKAIARTRLEVDFDDPADPRGAAAFALTEVLDPSSEVIDVKEVLARSAWAAVETVDEAAVLRFLLEADRLLAEGAPA